jgi:hypothetical protein
MLQYFFFPFYLSHAEEVVTLRFNNSFKVTRNTQTNKWFSVQFYHCGVISSASGVCFTFSTFLSLNIGRINTYINQGEVEIRTYRNSSEYRMRYKVQRHSNPKYYRKHISIRTMWRGLQRVNFNWPVATKNRVCLWKDNLERNIINDKPSLGIWMLTSQFSRNTERSLRRRAVLYRTQHETFVTTEWLEFPSGTEWSQFSVNSVNIFHWISQLVCVNIPFSTQISKMYDKVDPKSHAWKPYSYSDYDSGSESHPLVSSDASHTSRRSFGWVHAFNDIADSF